MHLTGRVGLFWGVGGILYHHAVALEQGLDDGDFINGRLDHVELWPSIQGRHRELQLLEYDELPRGRVVYVKATALFQVLADPTLMQPLYRDQIWEVFGLEGAHTRLLGDPHYTLSWDPEGR